MTRAVPAPFSSDRSLPTVSGAYVIAPLGNGFRKIGYNTGQPRFALYTGGDNQPANLNLHSVSFDTTPRIEVVNNSVNMAKSAITEARTINTIKRKYYDGAITATSSADWLVVSNLAAGETEVKAAILKARPLPWFRLRARPALRM